MCLREESGDGEEGNAVREKKMLMFGKMGWAVRGAEIGCSGCGWLMFGCWAEE